VNLSVSQPASQSVSQSRNCVCGSAFAIIRSGGPIRSQLQEAIPSHSISLIEEKVIKTSERLVQQLGVNTLGCIITFIWEFMRIVVKNVAEYFKLLMESRKHTV
jgi:hypothetical protein